MNDPKTYEEYNEFAELNEMQQAETQDITNNPDAPYRLNGKNKLLFIGILGALLILLSAVICVYMMVNDKAIDLGDGISIETDETEIDLRDIGLTTIDGLERLKSPAMIDLRGNKLPAEEVLALLEKYHDCEIWWSVPIGGNLIDCDQQNISVEGMSIDEVPLLRCFDRLESIDARGLDLNVINAINDLSLNCNMEWDIGIGSDRYSPDVTELVINGNVTDGSLNNLTAFTNLQKVDASGCTEYELLAELNQKMPECTIIWSVPFGPVEALSTDEVLDFNRVQIDDIEKINKDFENLKYLPNLKKVDMCGCGVPNEKMAEWRDRYPEHKFVWEVYITLGKEVIAVPTDIKVFSSLRTPTGPQGDEETYRDLFLYCTDLVALDLGHNKIKDISLVKNLKKLQAVIFMDNPIKDFSVLAELPELVFAEINKTKLRDVSFVKDCPKLLHLDVSETEWTLKNVDTLYECDNLRYCIIALAGVSNQTQLELRKRLPNCKIAWVVDDYWYVKNSPLRSAYRNAFTNYTLLETFVDWTNYSFIEGAKPKKPSGYYPPEHYKDELEAL